MLNWVHVDVFLGPLTHGAAALPLWIEVDLQRLRADHDPYWWGSYLIRLASLIGFGLYTIEVTSPLLSNYSCLYLAWYCDSHTEDASQKLHELWTTRHAGATLGEFGSIILISSLSSEISSPLTKVALLGFCLLILLVSVAIFSVHRTTCSRKCSPLQDPTSQINVNRLRCWSGSLDWLTDCG